MSRLRRTFRPMRTGIPARCQCRWRRSRLRVRSDQVRAPDNRAGHRAPVRCGGCREHPGEALTKHEVLELQHRVEQPQGGQRQLECAPPAQRFPSCPARGRSGRAARARHTPAIHPPACPARWDGRGRSDRAARARHTPAIHPQLAANSQSQCGLLGSPNAPGVLRCAIKLERRYDLPA